MQRLTKYSFKDDVLDVIMTQRSKRNERMQELQGVDDTEQAAPESMFPAALTR